MPAHEFIISVFCWVEKYLGGALPVMKPRRQGHQPWLNEPEVIKIELAGTFSGYAATRRFGGVSSGIF